MKEKLAGWIVRHRILLLTAMLLLISHAWLEPLVILLALCDRWIR